MELLDRQKRPPELIGFHWLNSEPISIRDSRGSIVLLEFWDFSNHRSIHGLRYVTEWHRRYREYGLVTVGVHSPKYEFGRVVENVEHALKSLTIDFPVVLDNDGSMAHAYGVRELPTRCLIDRDGFVRYWHSGEGGFEQFERAVQALLGEIGYHGVMPAFLEPLSELDLDGTVSHRQSSELEMGFLHGCLGNLDGYNPSSIVEYHNPGYYLTNRFYLDGKWIQEKEYVRFEGAEGELGLLSFRYEGSGVNAVMHGGGAGSRRLRIHQDSESIARRSAGDDMTFGAGDDGQVLVGRPRLYELVRNEEFGEHLLQISVESPGLEIYSFSFLTTLIPDFVQRN